MPDSEPKRWYNQVNHSVWQETGFESGSLIQLVCIRSGISRYATGSTRYYARSELARPLFWSNQPPLEEPSSDETSDDDVVPETQWWKIVLVLLLLAAAFAAQAYWQL